MKTNPQKFSEAENEFKALIAVMDIDTLISLAKELKVTWDEGDLPDGRVLIDCLHQITLEIEKRVNESA